MEDGDNIRISLLASHRKKPSEKQKKTKTNKMTVHSISPDGLVKCIEVRYKEIFSDIVYLKYFSKVVVFDIVEKIVLHIFFFFKTKTPQSLIRSTF